MRVIAADECVRPRGLGKAAAQQSRQSRLLDACRWPWLQRADRASCGRCPSRGLCMVSISAVVEGACRDFGDGKLGHAGGCWSRGIEHGCAQPGSCGQVDLVGAEAEAPTVRSCGLSRSTASVSWVCDRRPSTSKPLRAAIRFVSSSPLGRDSTSKPASESSWKATGWLLSSSKTRGRVTPRPRQVRREAGRAGRWLRRGWSGSGRCPRPAAGRRTGRWR